MLKFTEGDIIHQFSNLSDYYNKISSVIKSEKQHIMEKNEKFQNKLENESEDIREQYSDKYADDWYIIEMLEHTFCNSMTISIYTLIEKYLNEICDNLKEYKNIPIAYKDLKGNGIVRAIFYIKKFGNLVFDQNDSDFLNGINAIRNVIAHENGELYNFQKNKINNILNIFKIAPDFKINHTVYTNEMGKKIDIYKDLELGFMFIDYCLDHGKYLFMNIFKQF
jgi:hypothetical protein